MDDRTIYNMGLHESLIVQEIANTIIVATRVPGGWLYTEGVNNNHTTTFVPEPGYPEKMEVVRRQREAIGGEAI